LIRQLQIFFSPFKGGLLIQRVILENQSSRGLMKTCNLTLIKDWCVSCLYKHGLELFTF
jgi:hypothetical protein